MQQKSATKGPTGLLATKLETELLVAESPPEKLLNLGRVEAQLARACDRIWIHQIALTFIMENPSENSKLDPHRLKRNFGRLSQTGRGLISPL